MNTDDVNGDSSDDASNVGELFVEIPDECKQPKPLLFAEPSAEIVKEIRDFVAETGQSHMWRGHTHTRPPVGARVKYRARFELPETFVRARKFLVCPVCRPNSRNFGKREGMIAWFPDEGVIRLIGPDCFAELNKEGHNEALDELAKREKREEEFKFLLSQRDQHRVALNVLKASQQVAEALDDFGARLRKTLTETLNIDLWPHVRSGELQVIEKFRKSRPILAIRRTCGSWTPSGQSAMGRSTATSLLIREQRNTQPDLPFRSRRSKKSSQSTIGVNMSTCLRTAHAEPS